MCFVNTLEYLRHLKSEERLSLIESESSEDNGKFKEKMHCYTVEEKKKEDKEYKAPPAQAMTFRRAMPQVLATTAKNIVLLGYGMTLGFPTIVIPNISEPQEISISLTGEGDREPDPLQLNMAQISWFSSINMLCVPIGCALSGACTQPFGRKKSMLALNIPFILAWVLYHFSSTVGVLYTALAITGLTGGLLEAPVLTYVAEITDPELRGILSATSSTCVILGIFVQFLLGTWLSWRTVALLNIFFPLSAFTALLFVPESPHWLIGQERFEDARVSLQWLRGWVDPCDVEVELTHLKKVIRCPKTGISLRPNFGLYLKRNFLHPFGLVTFVFAVGHLGGMTILQTYAVNIFAEVGSPLDKYVSTVLLGLVQLIGAIVCVATIRFSGKKPLAICSTVCSGLFLMVVAVNTRLRGPDGNENTWLPLTCIVGSAFASHTCLRMLPWILIGEVFPPEVRATASGLAGGAGYLLGFVANKSYLYLVQAVDVWCALLMYSLVALVGGVLLLFVLPETEGLTLTEVQDHFEGRKRPCREQWARDNLAMDPVSHSK